MATYTVRNKAGKQIKFNWNKAEPPTKDDMARVFASAESGSTKPSPQKLERSLDIPGEPSIEPFAEPEARAAQRIYKPALEIGGLTAGGIVGSGAGPAGTIFGAGLGYAIGKQVSDLGDWLLGIKKKETKSEAYTGAAKDVVKGSAMEMGGQMLGVGIQKGMELGGKVLVPAFGRLTGVGPGAIKEAISSGKEVGFGTISSDFHKAIRGKITGEEVVNNARSALETIKNNRGQAYQARLAKITQNQSTLDITSIENKLSELLKSYRLIINKDGEVIPSGIGKLYKQEMSNINEIVSDVKKIIDNPNLRTPSELDLFKQKLDNFYSPNKDSRAFVTSLYNEVRSVLVKNVPQYEEMVSGYAEATKLIKDIESGLMLRKQGMSGRITADNTLRRLTSSMRDNFEMRKELVDVLGAKGNQDLAGQIAGYAMSAILPKGLSGTAPILVGEAAAIKYLNPKLWPILAASSPKVSGEFLQMYGRALSEFSGGTGAAGKAIAVGTGIGTE